LPEVKLDKQPVWFVLWNLFTEVYWRNREPDNDGTIIFV
jgi:hypothetical protein